MEARHLGPRLRADLGGMHARITTGSIAGRARPATMHAIFFFPLLALAETLYSDSGLPGRCLAFANWEVLNSNPVLFAGGRVP